MAPPASSPQAGESVGMSYLETPTRKFVTIYLPLACFILILLFPFYWMAITTFKPNSELLNYKDNNPFWITSPTL
ncbi:MAG: carbohydrate ABC transporter permease, partial [Microvirga sp.]